MKSTLTSALLALPLVMAALGANAALKPEPQGGVQPLPYPYPEHWIIAHDAAFKHMLEGRMVILDPLAKTQQEQYKGMLTSSFIGHFQQSPKRGEMYIAETFHSRGTRGERTDVLTIWDSKKLTPIDEIVLPTKRANTMPEKHALQFIDNERLLLVFNLTPATSVTVVDIDNRKVLNEVPIPGCSLIYPTGKRGFSSLCSNGSLYSVQLDATGKIAGQRRGNVFFDTNKDPLFEKPASVDGITYFPTFLGDMQPVDLRDSMPKIGKRWSLLSKTEREAGWRPGGWQLIGNDTGGLVYLLMHPKGYDGSHKDGGPEIWVYDVAKQTRLRRIKLRNWGVSLALSAGEEPLLIVTNGDMQLDVYRAHSGEFVRTLAAFGQETPFVVYPSR